MSSTQELIWEYVAKRFKKAILYGKINSKNASFLDIIKMSQTNCPNLTFKNPRIDCQTWKDCFGISFENLYRANETRYIDSDVNLRSPFNFKFENLKTRMVIVLKIENSNFLEVLDDAGGKPYSEEPGGCYNVKCSDQQRGGVHPVLSGMELKSMKVCTIILFTITTLAL